MKNNTLIAVLSFAAVITVAGLSPFAVQGQQTQQRQIENIPALNATHKIGEITVYRDRAMVRREATVALPAGKSAVTFADLPNDLDPKSLRAHMGSSEVELLGISFERIITNTILNDKLNELEKQKEKLEAQISELNDANTVVRHKQTLVSEFAGLRRQAIAEQAGAAADKSKTENWQKELKSLDEQRTSLETEANANNRKLEALHETLGKVVVELNKYAQARGGARITAVVSVNAAKAQSNAPIAISYMTYNAGWTPAYDARLNQADNKIGFTYRGIIRQHTGEDWKNVSLKLSTAQPQISATPPQLTSLWLGGRQQAANARQVVTERSVVAQANTMALLALGGAEMSEAAVSTVEERGPSVTFAITGMHTIPSGDQPGIVTITEGTYGGQWRYECVPAARQGVFLKAMFKNTSRYPILAGRASIYRNAGFIGNTGLKFFAPETEVDFFAGNADGLSAVRNLVAQKVIKEGVIATDNVEYTAYAVTMLNNTAKEVTVRLRDAVPVSQVDEVKVKLVKGHKEFPDTTEGYTLNEKTGLIYWDVKIPANSKKTVNLTWSISNQPAK